MTQDKMSWLIFSVIFNSIIFSHAANDITGCGGFLKSHTVIDFSKVDVKLYTKQGTLKDSSDCAPTNGYYFIPLSDNGEYTLSIDPPPGWFFEPKEVPIVFNGVSDPCSRSVDINFNFKGFAVTGRVSSRGYDKGPDGVTVILQTESGQDVVSTVTEKGGQYHIAPVQPGKYKIVARHPSLRFSSSSVVVTVSESGIEVPANALVIAGFDVSGVVVSNGEPVKGVHLLIYAAEGNNNGMPLECDKSEIAAARSGALCHVTSDSKGEFRFIGVPSGKYMLRPYYETFQVFPNELEIQVKLAHVNVLEKFMVKGFCVKGRVLSSKGGKGLGDVAVFVNNAEVAKTNSNGQFQLDRMEPGTYTLSAKSDDFRFPSTQVKISPTTPDLEPLIPNGVKVCGRVVPVPTSPPPKLQIRPASEGESILVTIPRDTGRFCEYLTPGEHTLSVVLPDTVESSNFQYLPFAKKIIVKDSVITGIEFSQLRANLKGRLIKLPQTLKDVNLTIKLKNQDFLVSSTILQDDSETYSFDDVQPGIYDIEVESKLLCIEPSTHRITVNAPEITLPNFKQVGYVIRIRSSHATPVDIKNLKGEKVKSINFVRGDNTICLPNMGHFLFAPKGCHGYEQNEFKWEVGRDTLYHLKAISHDFTGIITTDEKIAVSLDIKSHGQLVKELGPFIPSPLSEKSFRLEFKYRAIEGQHLEIIPRAQSMVFTPDVIELRGASACQEHSVQFHGEKGVLIEGKINPALEGVKVVLRNTVANSETIFITQTDGRFVFGPLKKNAQFELNAEKESYVITGPDTNHNFDAQKLAQVKVTVADNSTKSRLSGVLLSLTGGEKYRKNSITEDDGERTFHSLNPGEYFLRPMMKEYKFEPASAIIQLKAGETKVIALTGRRVAFSAFGFVTSLNGEAEENVPLEAIGQGKCQGLQEEGLSNASGSFRIRGLVPHCDYTLQMKSDPKSSVYRVSPPQQVIKTTEDDIYDIRLIAFHHIEHVDVNVHVTATNPEHLKTITIKLCEEDKPESPVHTVKLDTVAGGIKNWGTLAAQERFLRGGLVVPLPIIPISEKSYIIITESTLSSKAHAYTESSARFVANRPYVALPIHFHAVDRPIEQESPRHLVAAAFLLAIGLLYVQMRMGWPALTFIQNVLARQEGNSAVIDSTLRKKGRARKT